MIEKNDSDFQACTQAAAFGLWGLVALALLRKGEVSGHAAMDDVCEGRAFVSIDVLFSRRGMTVECDFCSNGERKSLFGATLHQPAADVPPAPAARH